MLETFHEASPQALALVAEEKSVRQTDEVFLLFALGSQFDHLIKQQLEKLGVYCLVADPATVTAADVEALDPIGIILSGGPASVHSEPPPFDAAIFDLGIPTLGICLGFQMWAKHIGVKVVPAAKREFGTHQATILVSEAALFADRFPQQTPVLESHGDRIELDERLTILAATENAPVAAAQYKHLWGVQFHPEVTETVEGGKLFSNFCFVVCNAQDSFPGWRVAEQKVAELKETIRGKRVLLALSGGTDSAVVAYLLKAAASPDTALRAIYISGVDRPDDLAHVLELFGGKHWIELCVVGGEDAFLRAVVGQTNMREKRLAMKGVYRQILEREIHNFKADYIAQGTLYTDLSESGLGYQSGARKAVIKTHHNTNNKFSVPELIPLADCVKDGGRNIGESLGVPPELLYRHPFPGPGLLLRIDGMVDRQKLSIARQLDSIYIEELRKWKLYTTVWQAGVVLTEAKISCTKGDDASEGLEVELWAVWSVNGFTARAAELPWDFIKHVSRRITNEMPEVGGVTYRVSDKPPTNIERG